MKLLFGVDQVFKSFDAFLFGDLSRAGWQLFLSLQDGSLLCQLIGVLLILLDVLGNLAVILVLWGFGRSTLVSLHLVVLSLFGLLLGMVD